MNHEHQHLRYSLNIKFTNIYSPSNINSLPLWHSKRTRWNGIRILYENTTFLSEEWKLAAAKIIHHLKKKIKTFATGHLHDSKKEKKNGNLSPTHDLLRHNSDVGRHWIVRKSGRRKRRRRERERERIWLGRKESESGGLYKGVVVVVGWHEEEGIVIVIWYMMTVEDS